MQCYTTTCSSSSRSRLGPLHKNRSNSTMKTTTAFFGGCRRLQTSVYASTVHDIVPTLHDVSPLKLYNTMTRKKETFVPLDDKNVTMYVCGVTVYDYSHIGHARAYVSFDVLYRYLRYLGYNVLYCRNFTDIDDKIIDRANAVGEDPLELSKRFAHEFHVDMDTLGCLRPSLEPLATNHISDMVDSISKIISHGHGYAVEGGDVFFDVASLPGYGKLSGRQIEDNRAGERVSVDGRKKNPEDFALWKSAKPGEPTWDSPWGPGRPGWHIECSAMIRSLLGETIDIHGGGSDLMFPHHENELAQARATSCCGGAHDQDYFARWWVHNGFVNVDSEKMSKSLGNFFTIRDVSESYHPLALRWFLIGTQYRQAINYTQRGLEEASDRLFYLYQTLFDAHTVLEGDTSPASSEAALLEEVLDALSDDLNTPLVLAAFSPALKTLNDLIHTKKGKKRPDRIPVMRDIVHSLDVSLGILGLRPTDFRQVLDELCAVALNRADLTEEDVQEAITQRAEARASKEYETADGVRKKLEARGIYIMDTPAGTTWKPGCPTAE
jgi:cysteinyl-tRNA synthetase